MNKTVLITGTSTGIGRACALHLDDLGFTVYAGVRRMGDAKDMQKEASERLRPIVLDVTDGASIEKAAAQIRKETGGGLDGLINNAGVGLGGPLELTPAEEIQKVINVNVTGLLLVTKACLPLLRASKGRVINIGSTSAYLAFPGIAVYAASKFAVRALTDALRLELLHVGIKVILVSPGAIESAIWDKGAAYRKGLYANTDPDKVGLYRALLRFGDSLYTDLNRIPAMEVARATAKALTRNHPKRYYIVGKDAKGAKKASFLPAAILDRIILKKIEKFAAK